MSETKRWTEKRGREVITRWRQSGLSMSAFARQRGLNTARIRYWRDRIGEEVSDGRCLARKEPAFVPSVVLEMGGCAAVSVQLPSGVVVDVRVPRDVAPQWVAELVRGLVEAP